jgi:phosphoglycerate kinase
MKLSIRDLDLKGKRVFVRVDFNVPIKGGAIGDDTRIRASLATIQHALDQGATVVLASHFGRPKGKPNPEFTLKPVADRLATLLGRPVVFATDCVGSAAADAVASAQKNGSHVVLLENVRFHAEEEKNDPGAAHRAHASVEGITHHVPRAAAGLLMEQEIKYLGHALESPERPFVAILGGAKASDKIEVIQNLLGKVDCLIIGGAMAYTFFKSRGVAVGRSLVEDDKLDEASRIETDAKARGVTLLLPSDHVVTTKLETGAPSATLAIGDAAIGDRLGVDIGPETIEAYTAAIGTAKTVVWNGPMGVFEIDQFAAGTNAVAHAVAAVKGTTIIGGGDSIAAVKKASVAERITHISTGGGASLECLGGRTLPGVAALAEARLCGLRS